MDAIVTEIMRRCNEGQPISNEDQARFAAAFQRVSDEERIALLPSFLTIPGICLAKELAACLKEFHTRTRFEHYQAQVGAGRSTKEEWPLSAERIGPYSFGAGGMGMSDEVGAEVLLTSVVYTKGGRSYYSGQSVPKGYYLDVRRETSTWAANGRVMGAIVAMGQAGYRHLLKEATRFDQRTLKKLAHEVPQADRDRIEAKVKADYVNACQVEAIQEDEQRERRAQKVSA